MVTQNLHRLFNKPPDSSGQTGILNTSFPLTDDGDWWRFTPVLTRRLQASLSFIRLDLFHFSQRVLVWLIFILKGQTGKTILITSSLSTKALLPFWPLLTRLVQTPIQKVKIYATTCILVSFAHVQSPKHSFQKVFFSSFGHPLKNCTRPKGGGSNDERVKSS